MLKEIKIHCFYLPGINCTFLLQLPIRTFNLMSSALLPPPSMHCNKLKIEVEFSRNKRSLTQQSVWWCFFFRDWLRLQQPLPCKCWPVPWAHQEVMLLSVSPLHMQRDPFKHDLHYCMYSRGGLSTLSRLSQPQFAKGLWSLTKHKEWDVKLNFQIWRPLRTLDSWW